MKGRRMLGQKDGSARTRARRAIATSTLVFAGTLITTAPLAPVASAAPTCNTSGNTVTCTFSAIGAAQEFVVPAGVTSVTVTLVGGTGGSSFDGRVGGLPGTLAGTLPVTPGETLQVNVGGSANGATAGWNGGGSGLDGSGGGGGATDLRRNGTALSNRILVAAGGGGAGASDVNGTGGRGGNGGVSGEAASGLAASGGGGAGTLSAGGAGGANVPPSFADGWLPATPSSTPGVAGSLGQGGSWARENPNIGSGAGGGGGGGGYYGGGSGGGGGHYIRAINQTGFEFGDSAGGGGGGGSNAILVTLTGGIEGATIGSPRAVFVYTVPDEAPTLTFDPSSVTRVVNVNCQAFVGSPPPSTVTGRPTPNVTYSPSSGTSITLGTTVVTATASNGVSPNAVSTYTVVAVDTTAPTITNLPANITTSTTDPAGAAVTYTSPSFTDNCPGGTIARTQGLASGATFPVGTTTVQYTATDSSDNPRSASFTVTVNLVTPPTIDAIADIRVDSPAAACSANVPAPTTNANGTPLPSVSFSPSMPSVFPVGITGVTATATNGVSPDATTNFRVTVRDVTPPTIGDVPADITTTAMDSSGAVVTFADPTVKDNCPNASLFQSDGPFSGSVFPPGETTVTYMATDGSNNSAIESFTVTVQTPPTVSSQGILHWRTDPDSCTATNVPEPTVFLGGFPTPTVTYSPPLTGPFPLSFNTVTITASNGVSPDATTELTIDVDDLTGPKLTMPASITVPATSAAGAVVTYPRPTAVDNCGSITQLRPWTGAYDSGNTFRIGTTTVEWFAVDSAGNPGFGSFSITVTPTAPTIEPIPTQYVDTDPDKCSVTNAPEPTVVTGGFPAPTVTFLPSFQTTFVGGVEVRATASNGVDPSAGYTFTVWVRDRQAPKIVTSPNIVVPATGPDGAVVTFPDATATDNCELASLSQIEGLASGQTFPIGTTTVRYQAADRSNNTDTASFTVTVEATAPTIARIVDIFRPTDPDLCWVAVPTPSPVATGVPEPTVTFSPRWPGVFDLGTTTVTATASNGISPDASTTFRVIVSDGQAPLLAQPSDIELQATSGAGRVVTFVTPFSSDNCIAPPTVTQVAGPVSGSTFPLGESVVTFRSTDRSGNWTERSFTVTITGAPPTIAPIAAIATTTGSSTCSVVVPAPATSTTGAPAPTVTFSPSFANPFPLGTTTVTATATNAISPDATTSFQVTVTDATAPGISTPANLNVNATGPTGAKVTYLPPTFSDNCPGVTLTRTAGPASGATFPIGDTTVTHVARDGAGNTSSSSFVVHVAGASEQITALIAQVSNTPPGQALARELADAQRALSRGDLRDACREMDSFVSLVKAQRGKKLTRAQADQFVAAAQRIIAVMNCRCLPTRR